MTRDRLLRHAAILLPAAVAAGCAGGGSRPDTSTLALVFADRAPEVVGGRARFTATGAGFTLDPVTHGSALRATLPARGEGPIRLETARGDSLLHFKGLVEFEREDGLLADF